MPNPSLRRTFTRYALILGFAPLLVTAAGQRLAAQPMVAPPGAHGASDNPSTQNIVWGAGVEWTPCSDGQNIVWSNAVDYDEFDSHRFDLVWGVAPADNDESVCGLPTADEEPHDAGADATAEPAASRPAGARGGGH